MGDSIFDYATSEASSSTTGGWNTAENQDPSTVNDGMRAHKQNVAKFLKDLGGTITTTGSANAHAATLNQPIATTVPTGFGFKVKWGYTNTSATVNLNINSIGNARVKVNYGGILADPIPGDIQAGAYGDLIFDGTNHVLLNPQQRAPYPSGHLNGLTPTNGTDATNDINFATGTARDGADSANIDLLTAMGKQLDTAWAVGGTTGTPLGMLATGVAVTDTTYYLFIIKRPDTGVVDFAADTSSTGANIAANTDAAYTIKRLVGRVLRSGGVNQRPISYAPVVHGSMTPTVTAGSGTITTSNASLTYTTYAGERVDFDCTVTITTAGTGTGVIILTTPFPVASAFGTGGREKATTGYAAAISADTGGTTMRISNYDGNSLIVDGYIISFSGNYRI